MDNEQGHSKAYREVIHEDKVKVGGTNKAPDYAFTLFGQRKFFVDAKKPGIRLKIFWMPGDLKYHGYEPHMFVKSIHEFFAIVKEDKLGCFWG